VRAALLFQSIYRMRLDQDGGSIEVVNRVEVHGKLKRMDGRFRSQLAEG